MAFRSAKGRLCKSVSVLILGTMVPSYEESQPRNAERRTSHWKFLVGYWIFPSAFRHFNTLTSFDVGPSTRDNVEMRLSRILPVTWAFTFLCISAVNAESYAPRVGQQHPEMTLPRIDGGGALSLSDYRGRKVLLIHFASW